MAPYTDLKAWEHAHKLAVECSRLARHFPEYERQGLADQLRRGGYNVVINIAEGSARRGTRDFRRLLDIARASLAEVQTILSLSNDLGYVHRDDHARVQALAEETGRTLYGLLRKVSEAAGRKVKTSR